MAPLALPHMDVLYAQVSKVSGLLCLSLMRNSMNLGGQCVPEGKSVIYIGPSTADSDNSPSCFPFQEF